MTPDDKLADRLLRWEEAWEHGRDLSPGDLCADEPDLEPELKERIAALKATAWVKEPPSDEGGEEADGAIQPPVLLGGRYRIEGLIAEGGQGRVYRAYDPELQRQVAVKIPKLRRCAGPEQADVLLEEARRAASLRHPGIVSVHDVGRHDGTCFIVADLIDGENLADRIARSCPGPDDAARLVAEIAEALQFAHDHGFVHRDIKPANILIDRQGRPLVTDFGIAATADDLERGRPATSGTLPYMAPEQVAGEVQLIDARTDLYALGVVLYELLAGRLPYQARTPAALREQILFRSPNPLGESIPPALGRVVMKCLAKHPTDRYPSARVLADELRAARSGESDQRRGLTLPLVITTVLLVAAGAWMVWGRPPGSEASRLLSSGLAGTTTSTKPAFATAGAMVFDGRTRVVTPLERSAPVTLEAWVRPDGYEDHGNQFLIGSDIPTRYGLGLTISGAILSAEYVPGMMFSDRSVPLGKCSHVAVVFGKDETRLYVDGEAVHVGPATEIRDGSPFVLGCAGRGNPIDHFRGWMRAVRISPGERYTGGFRPDETFAADPAADPCRAILIYDGEHVEGDRVLDLSGEGHHGWVERMNEAPERP